MFNIGDTVLYGAQGACKIESMVERSLVGKQQSYYVLKPIHQENSTCFVPVDNAELTGRMRQPLSRQEVCSLIDESRDMDTHWITDETQRKEKYQQILTGGDRRSMLHMVKTLDVHRTEQQANGKRLHQCDEKAFREAERRLFDEFSLALEVQPSEVLPFILTRISGHAPETL